MLKNRLHSTDAKRRQVFYFYFWGRNTFAYFITARSHTEVTPQFVQLAGVRVSITDTTLPAAVLFVESDV